MEEFKTYFRSEIEKSTIGQKSIIGDLSRIRNSNLGKCVKIDRNNLIQNSSIGDYTYTGPFDMVFNTRIGSFTSISYGVTIGPPEHNYKMLSMHPFVYNKEYDIIEESELLQNDKFDAPCSIGSDCWIGCNSTVLRGVEIPDGCIIGANTVVTKSPEPYSIIVGCPGVELKKRFDADTIAILLDLKWWNWPIDKIKKNSFLFLEKNFNKELLKKIK